METILVESHYYDRDYYLLTGKGSNKLFKLPFAYKDLEYCALIEDNRVVIYRVPSKLEESISDTAKKIEDMPLAEIIIPEGIISKIDIGPMTVTFSLDQTSSIFGLPNGNNTITMGQTVEGLLYAICSTNTGNDLYLFTYNDKNSTSEWVKTEENALKIEVLNSFAYKVSTKDKQKVVNFATHHLSPSMDDVIAHRLSPFKSDVTVTPLQTLEANRIDIVHSFVYDERKDWTRMGDELYCYYLLRNGNKTAIQVFSRHIYDKDNIYSIKTIYNGHIDDVQYLTDIKRRPSIKRSSHIKRPLYIERQSPIKRSLSVKGTISSYDKRVEVTAICGFKNGDLEFAYPIMFLDGNLVRTDNNVNIMGSLSIESSKRNIFFLSYPGNKKRSFHIYARHCKNGDRRIECSESKKHNDLEVVSDTKEHILLGTNNNVLDKYRPEKHYWYYYCDSKYNKTLVADAYRMDDLGEDGYIFYLQENNKWIVKVFDRQGSMLYVSDPIENIDDLKKDFMKKFHLLVLQHKDNIAVIRPLRSSFIDFDFLNIKDYRIITTDTSITNGSPIETILLEYEAVKRNTTGLHSNGYNHPKEYLLFTIDGQAHPCDFSRYYHVRHIEKQYFEVQPYPNGPVNVIRADIDGPRYCDPNEILGFQKTMTSLVGEKS